MASGYGLFAGKALALPRAAGPECQLAGSLCRAEPLPRLLEGLLGVLQRSRVDSGAESVQAKVPAVSVCRCLRGLPGVRLSHEGGQCPGPCRVCFVESDFLAAEGAWPHGCRHT